jgi:glutamate 5-kinase
LKQSLKDYKRIVIKIGSSLFCSISAGVNLDAVEKFCAQVVRLVESGHEVVVVSSGAIALGMHKLKLKERPGKLDGLSAAAAIGQNELMNAYSRFLGNKIFAAQILLTWEDFDKRDRYLNAKGTIQALLKLRNTVPVINENDSISTEEIKFGDNDTLSARVAGLVGADMLIILSDVDGLLEQDKKVVRVVDEITPQVRALASSTSKKTCVGGMLTKLDAARIAMESGIPCVIANGRKENIIFSVLDRPEESGTLFIPKGGLLARERWIAFGTKPKGRIAVDQGAKKALSEKKSLLSVGVILAQGDFERGDIVIVESGDAEIARGKAGMSCREINKVKGVRCAKEVIHRDDLVILSGSKR